MISNKKISPLKIFCLKLKLKRLEAKRGQEISNFIAMNPVQASRMDNVEKYLASHTLKRTISKIKALERILKNKN